MPEENKEPPAKLTKEQAANLAKLCAAIRSGDYEQGTRALRPSDNTFCCLGIACEISGLGGWEKDSNGNWFYISDSSKDMGNLSQLPAVRKFFGFDHNNGFREEQLSLLNDRHVPFSEIADWIEGAIARRWVEA